MKIYKMLVHYTALFTIPTAAAYYYWDPKSDEQIRKDVEAQVKPDAERRRKNQARFKELLLQREEAASNESKKQLEEITDFTTPRK